MEASVKETEEAAASANGVVEDPKPPEEPAADLEGEDAQEQAIPELEVEGDGQLSLKIGGRKPDSAEVKLRGGSIKVPKGQYEKGDVLNFLVKVRCTEIHAVDKIDNSTGEVVETVRRQIFKIQGVERVGK
jgi:hypothetical protein